MKKSKIGLFFGSFNPIHIGHLIIANFMAENTDLDKVWLVVSPHNPFKQKKSLAKDFDRLHLARLATEDNELLYISNIEFSLPKPSYTIDTLSYLKEKHPNNEFVLIIGGDNIATLPKWKNYEMILKHHQIFVYQRPGYNLGDLSDHESIHIFKAPLLSISASYIRDCIKKGSSIRYLVSNPVYEYLKVNPIYQKLLRTP